MTNQDKIKLYKTLNRGYPEDFNRAMDATGDLVDNYFVYLDTEDGINCDKELKRLPNADYKLCCVLLTMLLREDHFDNGCFSERYDKGQVLPIVNRMIALLEDEKRR